ncbi:hypothetical protein [Parasitella parasitica]|uniref:Uncharacterized protein n=1 Tax=Parasitella parasitica TaxID=35722 RepID=A0A0B7NKR3_9FUNG|nr:hypothetical protein [Parasitella parasitica]
MADHGGDSLGPRGLTIEQQRKIAAIQSQAATASLRSSNERFSVDRAESSLFVGELGPDVNDETLKQHFQRAKSVHVCRDRVSGKSLGYAYVNFHRSEDCLYTLNNMNYSLINGRPCRLMVADRDINKRSVGNGNLVVKNLPTSVDDKSLHDTFAQWGNVISCRVIKNPKADHCYAYVNYDSVGAAERAIELVNGSVLFGRKIQVGHQIPKSERDGPEDSSKHQQRFTNLYIKNIALDVTESDLKGLFASIGPVSSVLIQRDEYSNSKGFGFVNFDKPEDAEKAVHKLNDQEYRGKKLFVSRAQKKSEREDELRRQHVYQMPVEKPVKYQGANLYVKNLAENVDDDMLRKEFVRYGHITSAKVMRDEHTGVSKGFGFVCFASPEEATEAVIRMNGHRISSKEIYVALAQRKEDRRSLLEAQIQQKSATSSTSASPVQSRQQLQPTEVVDAIPAQLTLEALKPYAAETQKQMLGERIYSIIYEKYPQESGKLTGMMLENDKSLLIHLINHPDQLLEQAHEALQKMSDSPALYTANSPLQPQPQPHQQQQQSVATASTITLPVLVTSTSSSSDMSSQTEVPSFIKQPKTSISHPINTYPEISISWIVPADVLSFLSIAHLPEGLDLYDFLDPNVREKWLKFDDQQYQQFQHLQQSQLLRGNLCLSSCPGKKVRLSGPVRGRAAINRDLDQDFDRMAGYGITMLICCLDDTELEFLGAPWAKYEKAAKAHDMKIIRLPMVEGGCPKTLSEVRNAVLEVNKEIYKGHNVLAHCRGGVGRAGLFAGCWLLENLLCRSVERTVFVLRERRSTKAIETYAQAEYLIRYSMALNYRLGLPFRATTTTDLSRDIPFESQNGSPSIPFIAKLENSVLVDPALIQDDLLPVDAAAAVDVSTPPPAAAVYQTPELCASKYQSY